MLHSNKPITSLITIRQFTYIRGEGAAHEILPLSLLGLSGIASVLEILQGTPEVLDIILELVHSSERKKRVQLCPVLQLQQTFSNLKLRVPANLYKAIQSPQRVIYRDFKCIFSHCGR